MVKKQTPLTLENFDKLVPKVERIVKAEIEIFKFDVNERFSGLEQKINHLPTKEEFFSRMDKVVGELQKLRDEVIIVNHQYERTNKRVDKVDKHLGISTVEV